MNCDSFKESFVDYLEGNLSPEEEKELEKHLESCRECREEFEEIEKMISDIDEASEGIVVPKDFMENVRERALNIELPKQKRKRRPMRVLLIAAVILTMSAVTVFAAKEPLMELLKLINPEWRVSEIVDKGAGDRLNISKIDKDIKVTITDVIADDIQTLVSFRIEDLKSGKEYSASFNGGITIKERWGQLAEVKDAQMIASIFNSGGRGTLTLQPIDTEKKTINLSFNKLETKTTGSKETVEGNWSFEIPVKKLESRSYNIDAVIKAEHYTVEFNKITISPTLTKLSFNCRNGGKVNERVEWLEDLRIVANGKEYKPYNFGHGDWNPYSTIGFGKNEMTFDSMYFDNPKEIEIKLSRIGTRLTEAKPAEFVIKLDEKIPQEFEYHGSKLVVDNLKTGKTITFDLKQPEYSKEFEVIYTEIRPYEGFGAKKYFSTGGNSNEVYYVDEANNKYEYNDALLRWEEIRGKKPVMYIANTSYTLQPVEGFDITKEKFIKIVVKGYSKTRFVEGSVKVKLK